MDVLKTFLIVLGVFTLLFTFTIVHLIGPTGSPDMPQPAVTGFRSGGQVQVAVVGNSGTVQLEVKEGK